MSTFLRTQKSESTFLSTFLSEFTFLSTFLSKSIFLSTFLSTFGSSNPLWIIVIMLYQVMIHCSYTSVNNSGDLLYCYNKPKFGPGGVKMPFKVF